MITCGMEKARAIMARLVTDPVSAYTQNSTAKALIVEPSPETNWPAQTARKARNPLLEVPLSSVATMAAV
jgi:hypothetical protein